MTTHPTKIWWLHPGLVVTAITGTAALAAYLIPESRYALYWHTPKYFGGLHLCFALLSIAAFVFGCSVGTSHYFGMERQPDEDWSDKIPWRTLFILFNVSFYICVTGYILWAASAIHLGVDLPMLVRVLTGRKGALEDLKNNYLTTIVGVTSLGNLDVGAIVLGFLLGKKYGWQIVRKKCWIIFLLAFIRAFLNMERLAVIQLAVPWGVLYLQLVYLRSTEIKSRVRRLVQMAPLIGPAVLYGVFTASEYFRSWMNFYSSGGLNLFEFGALRLLGYYVTALNNGAYLLQRLPVPLGAPLFSLDLLWRFPFMNELVKAAFPNFLTDSINYTKLLESGANPEFNNPDGILLPIVDFGLGGGLIYWLAAGLICGILYSLFRCNHPVGLCLYPVVFVGLMEVPRILFCTAGRIFPTWCLLFATCVVIATFRPPPKFDWDSPGGVLPQLSTTA